MLEMYNGKNMGIVNKNNDMKGLLNNIVILKEEDLTYECLVKFEKRKVQIRFPNYLEEYMKFVCDEENKVIFLNQFYEMCFGNKLIGLDIYDVVQSLKNLEEIMFISLLVDLKNCDNDIEILKKICFKTKHPAIFRIEGDVTLKEVNEIVSRLFSESIKKDNINVLSAEYKEQGYDNTARISLWYKE